jgi:beta-D-xylosidase 4
MKTTTRGILIHTLFFTHSHARTHTHVHTPLSIEWTPFDAILQHLPASTALAGVPSVGSGDTSGVAAAAAAAAKAPLVVLTIGSDLSLEQEGHDRTSIDFSDGQKALIAAVTAAAVGPVVALVFSGGAMDVSILLNNPKIVGVLICGQPSVAVVGAGDVLFGATLEGRPVAPAARMSQTTYPALFTQLAAITDFTMRPSAPGSTTFNPGRTYRFYTGVPVLPFGYGLSYTTWVYTPIPDPHPPKSGLASPAATLTTTVDLSAVEAAALDHATTGPIGHIPKGLQAYAANFWVNVSNTGAVDSDDVVLGFLTPPGAGTNGVPLQELFGFERVFVPAGQTVAVYLGAQGVRFTQAGEDGVRRVLRGEYTVTFGVRETAEHGMGFAQLKINAV